MSGGREWVSIGPAASSLLCLLPAFPRPCFILRPVLAPRHEHLEPCALPLFARLREGDTRDAEYLPREVEPVSSPPLSVAGAPVEDGLLVIIGDPDAVVLVDQPHAIRAHGETERDPGCLHAVLDGVVYQVVEYLLKHRVREDLDPAHLRGDLESLELHVRRSPPAGCLNIDPLGALRAHVLVVPCELEVPLDRLACRAGLEEEREDVLVRAPLLS